MYTFRFAKRSRMNGPPKLFASRALIGWNLKTCQTEISRTVTVKKLVTFYVVANPYNWKKDSMKNVF